MRGKKIIVSIVVVLRISKSNYKKEYFQLQFYSLVATVDKRGNITEEAEKFFNKRSYLSYK